MANGAGRNKAQTLLGIETKGLLNIGLEPVRRNKAQTLLGIETDCDMRIGLLG
jgi:hypothetical protein